MATKQTLLLAFLGAFVGTAAGFLGAKSLFKPPVQAASSGLEKLSAMSDTEFLSSYPSQKNQLLAAERGLGDRLFTCLEETQASNRTKKQNQKPAESANEKTQSSNDKPEMIDSAASDDFSIYGRSGVNTPPQYVPGARLLQLFANVPFKHSNLENFGVENGLIDNAKDFLKNHTCSNPTFSGITNEERNRSKFFDLVKDNGFVGITSISLSGSKSSPKNFNTKILFNSSTHHGYDYLEITDQNKNFLEKRIIKTENSDDAWRYSSCEPSVVLLSDKCPWNTQYAYEFKEFYLSPDSKKMVGNIYCKKASDPQWTNVGMFDLNQSTEIAE